MRTHHIGIIVNDLDKNIELYLNLGYEKISDTIIDRIQNNRVLFCKSCDGAQTIELIEPIDEHSSIRNFKSGYHHICYEAEPGEDIIQKFKEMRIGKIFTKPIVAPALDGRKVVFACLQNGTFIEFILQGEEFR